jgi:hypothetical protein
LYEIDTWHDNISFSEAEYLAIPAGVGLVGGINYLATKYNILTS